MKRATGALRVIVGMLIVMSLPPSRAFATPEHPIVVSMGDSYASGEGIEDFYGQHDSDKYSNQDFLAHRSEESWSGGLVVYGVELSDVRAIPSNETVQVGDIRQYGYDDWQDDNPDGSWFFVAASGAQTRHVVGHGGSDGGRQQKAYDTRMISRGHGPRYKKGVYAALAPQIDVFDYINQNYGEDSVDYVTISIGGNDLGFSNIVEIAATQSTRLTPGVLPQKIEKAMEAYRNGVNDDIEEALKAVREAAGPQAIIIVAGYPRLFDGANRSGFGLSPHEMKQLDEAALWLDDELTTLVERTLGGEDEGFYYVSVIDEFETHGAYSDEEWINEIIISRRPQDLPLTGVASSYSVHPNAEGAAAYAKAVQEVINRTGGGNIPSTTSAESRVALLAYQAFLQNILDACDTERGGCPAISDHHSGDGYDFTNYTSFHSFAIGRFGEGGDTGLLVCLENESDLSAHPFYTICLFIYNPGSQPGWDQASVDFMQSPPFDGIPCTDVLLVGYCQTGLSLSGARFYSAPAIEGHDSREVELFFDGQDTSSERYWLTDFSFYQDPWGYYLLCVCPGDDGAFHAWSCLWSGWTGEVRARLDSTALDPSEAKYWYDRAYIVPGKTTFYKFDQESISSIV